LEIVGCKSDRLLGKRLQALDSLPPLEPLRLPALTLWDHAYHFLAPATFCSAFHSCMRFHIKR